MMSKNEKDQFLIAKHAVAGAIGAGITGFVGSGMAAWVIGGATFSATVFVFSGGNVKQVADFLPLIKYIALTGAIIGGIQSVADGAMVGIGESLLNYEINPFLAGLLYPSFKVLKYIPMMGAILNTDTIDKVKEINQVGYDYLTNDLLFPELDLAGENANSDAKMLQEI